MWVAVVAGLVPAIHAAAPQISRLLGLPSVRAYDEGAVFRVDCIVSCPSLVEDGTPAGAPIVDWS
jgi:hypothetical protein